VASAATLSKIHLIVIRALAALSERQVFAGKLLAADARFTSRGRRRRLPCKRVFALPLPAG